MTQLHLVPKDAAHAAVVSFAEFWALYPRRVAKRDAQRIWQRLSPADQRAAVAALPAHVRAWKDTERRFIPHPSTWLHQARWEDELAEGALGESPEQLVADLEAACRR